MKGEEWQPNLRKNQSIVFLFLWFGLFFYVCHLSDDVANHRSRLFIIIIPPKFTKTTGLELNANFPSVVLEDLSNRYTQTPFSRFTPCVFPSQCIIPAALSSLLSQIIKHCVWSSLFCANDVPNKAEWTIADFSGVAQCCAVLHLATNIYMNVCEFIYWVLS